MNIPHININQTFALLGLSIQPSRMDIQKENSSINLQTERAKLEIKQQKADIQVDWQPVWDDIGLKKPTDIAREIEHEAKSTTLQAIEQTANHGDRLGNIAGGEQAVYAHLQKEKFFRDAEVHSNVGLMPKNQPVYKVETYAPHIQFHPGDLQVNPNSIDPVIDYQISKMDVYWIQEPNVDIYI